jgi:DNA-binding transcriptional MerR regulator
LRIGALARAAGVSPRTLRHYESQGLIRARRGANGYRVFDAAAVEQVGWIRDMLDCGFGTRQIAGMMDCLGGAYDARTCAAGLALFLRKRDELDELIAVLAARRARLERRIAHFAPHSHADQPADAPDEGTQHAKY